jgi:hypothetical protein
MKKKFFLASLKSMKREVGSGSGSISQRYGSGSARKCHGSPTLWETRRKSSLHDPNRNQLFEKMGVVWREEGAVTPALSVFLTIRQSPNFKTFKEPMNRFQGISSASLYSLVGRYDNPILTRFLAPIECLKIPALGFQQTSLHQLSFKNNRLW